MPTGMVPGGSEAACPDIAGAVLLPGWAVNAACGPEEVALSHDLKSCPVIRGRRRVGWH